ncbi:hypothetical protein GBSOP10_110611 [Armatimonadetes bacterium GBS]|jgi:hypothetical protein|nr:hypothetical protein GBSOP10_110611 [Armatimonadetes bacterium GBS]CUU35090.1 hypothetical protein GXSOP10_119157 [Armatimonadetes bacterium GXS]
MWRIQTVLAVLFASMLVSFSQMNFFAIHGSTADPEDDDTLALSAVGPGPAASLRINLMFISGLGNQPIRSALFEFTPATPIAVPNGQLLFATADPAQASNQLQVTARSVPGARIGQASFPARFQIRDNNGNIQEQQGTIQITVTDTEPYAFQRPNPTAPRDRIQIQFIINNVPVTYVGQLATPRGQANLFVGGRVI